MIRVSKTTRRILWNDWAQAHWEFHQSLVDSLDQKGDPTGITQNRAKNWAFSQMLRRNAAWERYARTVPRGAQRVMPAVL